MWNLIAITTKIGLTVVVAMSSLDSQAYQSLGKRYIAFFNETKKEYIKYISRLTYNTLTE